MGESCVVLLVEFLRKFYPAGSIADNVLLIMLCVRDAVCGAALNIRNRPIQKLNTETTKDNAPLNEALESLTQIACLDDNEKDSSSNQEALELCTNYTKDTTSVILKHLKLNSPSDTKN